MAALISKKMYGVSLKTAIQKWELEHTEDHTKAKTICLDSHRPPLERMTPEIMRNLRQCRHLILSNNLISSISGLNGLKNLRILNLSRNNLVSLAGIECLGKTLEELWVSFNYIEKLKPLETMKNLSVLLISHNNINDWCELSRLAKLPKLVALSFSGNPLQRTMEDEDFRQQLIKRLPKLKLLDFEPTNLDY